MKKAWPWALATAVAVVGIVLLARGSGGATSSALARGALGWRGVALLLEHGGIESRLLDRELGHRDPELEGAISDRVEGPATTLVLGFPWQRGGFGWDPAPVVGFVRRGGRLVIGTSSGAEPTASERRLLDALAIGWETRPRSGALNPLRWWRERQRGESWPASRSAPWSQPLATGSLGGIARPPAGAAATVLAVDDEGGPVASVFAHRQGEVWLLPAQALANGYLGRPGNAALALLLADHVEGSVLFDEYHHGLLGAEARLAEPAGRAFDAVLAQLGLLWVLAVLAFAWRFGPAWPARAQLDDAHRSFLLGLGALHQRLGHEREAAFALVRRVSAYDPALLPPEELEAALERAANTPLRQLARELSRPPRSPGREPRPRAQTGALR